MKQSRLLPNLVLWLFPVVVVALIAALVGAAIAASNLLGGSTPGRLILQWVILPLAVAVLLAAREAWRFKPEPTEGVEVSSTEHPWLWAEVGHLASLAETAPPDRIVIVPEVNAAVTEAAGQREMIIGLPLLATFTRGQLRSVLAHELGHFAGGDTAEATKAMRRLAFLDRVRARAHVVWRWFFTAYARLYALATGPSSRQAELRADELSVRAAGPEVAAGALRAVVRTDIAWDLALENYLSLFALAGRRAPLGEALRNLIAANTEDLEPAVDAALAGEQPSATDTHPPTRERIARFRAAAAAGHVPRPAPDAYAPAVDLLTGGAAWLDDAEGLLLTQDRPLATWDDVIASGVRASVDGATDQLGAALRAQEVADGGLDSVLRLIDRGGVVRLLAGEEGEQAREDTVEALSNPVLSAMLAAGAARVIPSWSGPAAIVGPDGAPLDVGERVAAAVDASDSGDLRRWLAEQGVDVSNARTAGPDVPQWLAAASHVTGPWEGRRDVHLWTHGVLALPPLDKATIKENKEQFSVKHQHPRLHLAAAEGLEAGRALPGALWWDAARITGGGVTSKRTRTQVRFVLDDGSDLTLASTLETAMVDAPENLGDAVRYLTAPRG